MWSQRHGRLRPVGCGVEELRRRRREREAGAGRRGNTGGWGFGAGRQDEEGGRRGSGSWVPLPPQPAPLSPALRKARREQQLVSKRLLRDDAPEEADGGCVAPILGETEVRGQGAW